MTRINTLSQLAAAKEPPPSGVWRMAIGVLGAAFGAASSPKPAARRIVR